MNFSSQYFGAQGEGQENNESKIDSEEASKLAWIPKNYSIYSKFKRADATKNYSWPKEKLINKGIISRISFSPCGTNLAVIEGEVIKILMIENISKEYTLHGHLDEIFCLEYSPEGKLLATGSKDCSIKLWNLQELDVEFTFNKHSNAVTCLSFSPTGKLIVTGSDDQTIIIWNLLTKTDEFTLNETFVQLYCVCFSPDSSSIAIASSERKILIWNVEKKTIDFTLGNESPHGETCLAYSPDGNLIASQTIQSNKIVIWSVKQKQQEFILYGDNCKKSCLAFSTDGVYLAATSGFNNVVVWNVQERKKECSLYNPLVSCLSYSNDGKYLAVRSELKNIKIWKVQTKRLVLETDENNSYPAKVSLSSGGKFLAAVIMNKRVKVFNIQGKSSFMINDDFSKVCCVSISPCENFLAIGCRNGKLNIWNIFENKEEFAIRINSSDIIDLFYCCNGMLLALACLRDIKIFDVKKQLQESTFSIDCGITCISCSPQGKYIAIGTKSEKIIVYNLKKKQEELVFNGQCSSITVICMSLTEEYLATSSNDQNLKIWNFHRRALQITKKIHCFFITSFAFISNCSYLAIGISLPCIKIWDFIKDTDILILDYFGNNPYSISSSVENRYLSVGHHEGSIKVWDLNGENEECHLESKFYRELNFSYSPFLNKYPNDDRLVNNIEDKNLKYLSGDSCKIFTLDQKYFIVGSKNMSLTVANDKTQFFYIHSTVSCFSLFSEIGLLAIGHTNGKISIFNLRNMKVDFTICYSLNNQIYELSFTNNGKYLNILSFEIFKTSVFNKLCFILSKNLINCIKQQESLTDLYKDTLISIEIKNYCDDLIACNKIAQDKFCEIISQLVLQYSYKKCSTLAQLISKYVLKFAKIGIGITYISIQANRALQIIKKTETNIDNEINLQVLMFLYITATEIKERCQIKSRYEELVIINRSNSKSFLDINPWNRYKIEKIIDSKNLKPLECYWDIHQKYVLIRYSKSSLSMANVMIKEYVINHNSTKNLKNNITSEIEKEIKCYELMHNFNIESMISCYYLGHYQFENTFGLVIKDYGKTLQDFIQDLIQDTFKRSYFFHGKKFEIMIKTILKSFAYLASMDILHHWICPTSIQVDDNFNIAITDFIFACMKINEIYTQSQNIFHKMKNDFSSPEEVMNNEDKFMDLEKCDVYSLGLVFLQLACLSDIIDIKNNLEFYLQKLDSTGLYWLKNLLSNMLCSNPENRLTFRELNQNIEFIF